MEKDTKMKNTQMNFISEFPSFQIYYFPKRLIFDKEGLIFDMGEAISSPRLRDFLSKIKEKFVNHFL